MNESDTPRTDFILKASDSLANCKDVTPYAVQVVCRQLERELSAERKRADDAISAGRQVADYNMELLKLLADANRRADEAEAKLYNIARTPVMPFPDPGAHSERAFSDAVYRAWSDIQRIARNREVKNG